MTSSVLSGTASIDTVIQQSFQEKLLDLTAAEETLAAATEEQAFAEAVVAEEVAVAEEEAASEAAAAAAEVSATPVVERKKLIDMQPSISLELPPSPEPQEEKVRVC